MNMGMAEQERLEHEAYMREYDQRMGHKSWCLISISPAYGGGYCTCGVFERGISSYDPLSHTVRPQNDREWWYGGLMYFWGFLSGISVLLILLVVMDWAGVL